LSLSLLSSVFVLVVVIITEEKIAALGHFAQSIGQHFDQAMCQQVCVLQRFVEVLLGDFEQMVSSSATALAERGSSPINTISPMKSPRSRVSTDTSIAPTLDLIATRPDSMM